jgi:hypothetical protein
VSGVVVRRPALAVLLTGLNDLSLPLSYVNASLQLLAHGGVLGVKARGQAGKAHIVDGRIVFPAHGPGRASCEGA